MPLLDNPDHWRNRAEEMRAQAEQTADNALRNALLESVKRYEHLAKRAEERLGLVEVVEK
jgi:hypothetical protein